MAVAIAAVRAAAVRAAAMTVAVTVAVMMIRDAPGWCAPHRGTQVSSVSDRGTI